MDIKPEIYYIRGQFLVINTDHALTLRRQRILGRAIGCPSKNPHQLVAGGSPYLISHYSARIANEQDLAIFKQLKSKEKVDPAMNKMAFERNLSQLSEKAKSDFVQKRTEELQKRGIEVSPARLGQFEESKLRWQMIHHPDVNYSSFQDTTLVDSVLNGLFRTHSQKMVVFRDLYKRGLYVSSGMKFGGDFLVYLGDPVRYHAQFVVRLVPDQGGFIDLKQTNYNELNALHRVSHTAKKIPLFVTVIDSSGETTVVKYWTLRTRVYLGAESDETSFEVVDPAITNLRYLSNVAFGSIEYKTGFE